MVRKKVEGNEEQRREAARQARREGETPTRSRAPATWTGSGRALLHDLTAVHRMVTELQSADEPDMGPRFEAKLRR